MRLGGGVADDRTPVGEHGGEQHVLGGGDAHLVEQNVRAVQSPGAEPVALATGVDLGAERLQREQMRIDAAAADDVAAGRRQLGMAEARQQRACDEQRHTDLAPELRIDAAARDAGRRRDQCAFAAGLDLDAQAAQQRDEDVDVADAGKIAQLYRLIAEQRCRQCRACGVLVSGYPHGAVQAATTADNQALHNFLLRLERRRANSSTERKFTLNACAVNASSAQSRRRNGMVDPGPWSRG